MACRRLAVLQGYCEYKSPLCVPAPVRCCICRRSRRLSCALWLCVCIGYLIPLLSVRCIVRRSRRVCIAVYYRLCLGVLYRPLPHTCPAALPLLAAHMTAAVTALQNTMVFCNPAPMRFLGFKSGAMIAKTFTINYLHLYGVFCNASQAFMAGTHSP